MSEKMTFEKSLKRIENIVSLLEKDDISLDDSLALYEEGVKLCAFCDSELKNAEQKIIKFNELKEEIDK